MNNVDTIEYETKNVIMYGRKEVVAVVECRRSSLVQAGLG